MTVPNGMKKKRCQEPNDSCMSLTWVPSCTRRRGLKSRVSGAALRPGRASDAAPASLPHRGENGLEDLIRRTASLFPDTARLRPPPALRGSRADDPHRAAFSPGYL
jgi:hypothetical protein